MNSWSVFEEVESNQNTRKTKKLIFPECLILSLNIKSTYGIVLFFGTILPSSFWGLVTSNAEWQSFSQDELKCQTRSTALLWVGGVGTGREKRAYDIKRPCKPQQTAMWCSDSASPKPHLKRDTFPIVPICFETPWGSKHSDFKRAFLRRWSTILVLTYR